MKDSELIFGLMASIGKKEYSILELKHLILPFDVSETSLRTNLSRMAARGTLEVRREGKKAYYRFGKKGIRIKTNVGRSFEHCDWKDWNNEFWGVAFSVPDMQSDKRHYIRKTLQNYHFASLYPGFWIRPLNEAEEIPKYLENIIATEYCSLIKFENYIEITKEQIAQLWKLEKVNEHFYKGLDVLEQSMKSIGKLSAKQAFVEKMRIGDEIVKILFEDPLLPRKFLPKSWAGEMLRERFKEFDIKMTRVSKPYWEKIFSDLALPHRIEQIESGDLQLI